MNTTASHGLRTVDLVLIPLFSVLIAVCSWISIPTMVPFTLQTFAVCLAVGLLGGKRGTLSVLIYLLLGAVGVPVFAHFTGGMGILLGNTGGYLVGFLFTALVMWAFEKAAEKSFPVLILSMALGILVCYAFGTAWFLLVYTKANGPTGLLTVLGWCVFPFLIPDAVKVAAAAVLTRRLRRMIP